MKKTPANIECYKAGAKACSEAKQGAINPHTPESAEARAWDNGYLDRQKRSASRDAGEYQKRDTLHLKGLSSAENTDSLKSENTKM